MTAVLWVIFLVPESKQKAEKKKMRFLSFDSFRAIWSVYKKPRNGGRKNLILLLVSDGIINLGVMGISGVVALFVLRSPLCWGPATLGVFMAFRFFMQGFGGIVGIGLLKRCMSEINVTRVGMVTQCASLVFFAFSDRTWMVFLGKSKWISLYDLLLRDNIVPKICWLLCLQGNRRPTEKSWRLWARSCRRGCFMEGQILWPKKALV